MSNLTGKTILLIVSGGIAAFKIPDLIRRLRERGAAIDIKTRSVFLGQAVENQAAGICRIRFHRAGKIHIRAILQRAIVHEAVSAIR